MTAKRVTFVFDIIDLASKGLAKDCLNLFPGRPTLELRQYFVE
jgi:hypothetical protein